MNASSVPDANDSQPVAQVKKSTSGRDLTKLRIRVAELQGWKEGTTGLWKDPDATGYYPLPRFENDLNSCHEFEKDAPLEYWSKVSDLTGAGGMSVSLQAFKRIGLRTPEQCCRAFVAVMEGRSVQGGNEKI